MKTSITDQPSRNSELVFAIASPVGTDVDVLQNALVDALSRFKYVTKLIRITDLLKNLSLTTRLRFKPEVQRLESHMDAGDEARRSTASGDFLALCAIRNIQSSRPSRIPKPQNRVAYLIRSLKHPDEVRTLRNTYGDGFHLIGVHSSEARQLRYLVDRKGMSEMDAQKLIARDREEDDLLGQQMGRTYHLADFFVDADRDPASQQETIGRFIDIVFGHPYCTPTIDEYAMFMAFSSALRSADLSRQVGAVVVSSTGDLASCGANDVPAFGGSLYWPGPQDQRDYRRGLDSNRAVRAEILDEVWDRFPELFKEGLTRQEATDRLRGTGIMRITEYGRAVHAEMEALLSCARIGVSPHDGTLYSTTFPCHNCAKHIVGAGVRRVVYVEPYPKSQALRLHDDSITLGPIPGDTGLRQVVFDPFFGVGPRKYFDMFSMQLGSGTPITRHKDGRVVNWQRERSHPRIGLVPSSFLDREQMAAATLERLRGKLGNVTSA